MNYDNLNLLTELNIDTLTAKFNSRMLKRTHCYISLNGILPSPFYELKILLGCVIESGLRVPGYGPNTYN